MPRILCVAAMGLVELDNEEEVVAVAAEKPPEGEPQVDAVSAALHDITSAPSSQRASLLECLLD